jgi:hypothetical protein
MVPVVTATRHPRHREHPERRGRVAARTRLDFWFDAGILAGYTVAYSYGFTGDVIHEWLGAVRFLRRLAVVTAVVAVVVLTGLAWHHFAFGSLGGQGRAGSGELFVRGQPVNGSQHGAKKLPAGSKARPGIRLNGPGSSGIPPIQLGDLLQPANLAVLRNTAGIEAAVIAAVVIVDAGRRTWRRARRAALAQPRRLAGRDQDPRARGKPP